MILFPFFFGIKKFHPKYVRNRQHLSVFLNRLKTQFCGWMLIYGTCSFSYSLSGWIFVDRNMLVPEPSRRRGPHTTSAWTKTTFVRVVNGHRMGCVWKFIFGTPHTIGMFVHDVTFICLTWMGFRMFEWCMYVPKWLICMVHVAYHTWILWILKNPLFFWPSDVSTWAVRQLDLQLWRIISLEVHGGLNLRVKSFAENWWKNICNARVVILPTQTIWSN